MAVHTIFKFIPNLLKRGRKASFILHSLDDEDLSEFRKESTGLVQNMLIIREKKPRKLKDDEYYLSTDRWDNNEQQYIEKTSGAFFVHDNLDESETEFASRMENYRKYYPVVFISPDPEGGDDEHFSSHISGWKEYTSKTGIIIFVNKGRKDFEDYTVDFKNMLDEETREVKPVISVRAGENGSLVEQVFDTGLGKKVSSKKKLPAPITQKKSKTEEDWSIFEGLPRPSMPPDQTNPTWTKEFYLYLRDLVSRVTPPGKEKLIDLIVNKNTINDVWFNVFTSDVVSYNRGENYEAYEAVGDSVIKYAFYIYLYERFGSDIDKDQLNDIKTKYLSTEWQAIAGDKMGLTEWLLIPKELKSHPKIKEDMQEAFCGALEIILNKIIPNQGYVKMMFVYMFQKLFGDVEFNLDKKLTPKETTLEQWYAGVSHARIDEKMVIKRPQSISREDWKKITHDFGGVMKKHGVMMPITEIAGKNETGVRYEHDVNKDGSATYRVYLNDAAYKFLKEEGFKVDSLKNRLLAEAKSGTLGQAKKMAKVRAMEKLESMGLTQEWREKGKMKKNTKDVQRIDEALIKARHEFGNKVQKVYPEKVKTTKSFSVYTLFAVMKDGRKEILEQIVIFPGGESNPARVFQDLVDKYISSDGSGSESDD